MNVRLIIASLLFSTALTANAQTENTRSKSIYLELLGPSNGVGVNFDSRFNKDTAWGYRVGFGFGYYRSNSFFGANESSRAYTIPLGVNYLVGKNKHQLEVGVGVNVGLYNDHYTIARLEKNEVMSDSKFDHKKENNFGAFGFATLGYRYTARKGFQFRIGVTPAYVWGSNRETKNKFVLAPYISFGKAF